MSIIEKLRATPDTPGTGYSVLYPKADGLWYFKDDAGVEHQVGVGSTTVVKRKTASESVTSSTTLQDDDHLSFAIGANEEWVADFEIWWSAATAGGIKVAVTTPSGATNRFSGFNADANGFITAQLGSTSGSVLMSNATNSVSGIVRVSAWVLNGATPGNVTLQWAQSVSNGTPTTFIIGSFLTAHRVA